MNFKNKENLSFLTIILVEITAIILAVLWILPREIVLISTGILIFYFLFADVKKSLIVFIVSIPLFIALPITEGFDSMANWRILLALLFLVWFFKRRWPQVKKELFTTPCCQLKFKITSRLTKFILLFLIIGGFSVFIAENPLIGIKKLLFLINIFLLFPIIKDISKEEAEKKKIIEAAKISLLIVLIVGYLQLGLIFFVPLDVFWQGWAERAIPVFYGSNLSETLKVSNTWFSYYQDKLPTLRMFSVFPDSHSFAMFLIIGLNFLVYLLTENGKRKNSPTWILIVFAVLALVFSGSRGVWVSAALPFLVVIFLYFFKKQKSLKPLLLIFLIFVLSFPASSLISSLPRGEKDASLSFKRAKSVTDMDELSVRSRMGIWKTSLESIFKNPILGVGIGNYPVVLNEDFSAAKRGASAHNLYLDIASETGILGLAIFLMIIFEIIKKTLQLVHQKNYYGVWFLFFFGWILIYNLFDVVLFNDKVFLFFIIPVAILYTYD